MSRSSEKFHRQKDFEAGDQKGAKKKRSIIEATKD